jgi:hypothetical protein
VTDVSLSTASGWLAVALLAGTGGVPIVHRILAGRRAVVASKATRTHAVLGLTTAALAMGHTLTVLPSLGSPAAVAGGSLALAPGAVAFFLLFAHVGVGLELREPRLRNRARKRTLHAIIATAIVVFASLHVALMRRSL